METNLVLNSLVKTDCKLLANCLTSLCLPTEHIISVQTNKPKKVTPETFFDLSEMSLLLRGQSLQKKESSGSMSWNRL